MYGRDICFWCQFIAIPYGLPNADVLMQDLHPNPLTPDPNDMRTRDEETSLELQRGEEPSVLAAGVALLQHLLDVLLGILPLCDLLEGVV